MKCGFYEKDITPPLGGDMTGYYAHRYAMDVLDNLYAKAVVFSPDDEDPAKMTALLIIDAELLSTPMTRAMKARIHEFTAIPEDRIAIAATHSHYSIPQGDVVSIRDEEYMAVFPRLAADAVILAFKRLQKCTMTYGMGREAGVSFVRNYLLDDGAIVTNPRQYIEHIVRPHSDNDPDLPVLTFWNEEGQRLGVLFTFALHSDTTKHHAYSGDYSSEISKQLKKRYGVDFISIYMAGFCGNINHWDPTENTKRNHRSIGQILANEIIRVTEEASSPLNGDNLAMVQQILPMQRRRATAEQLALARYYVENPGTKKYDMTGSTAKLLLMYEQSCGDSSDDVSVPLQVMRIGDVWLYICPFEMYNQYASPLKEATPGGKWLMAELANMEASYVPVPELLDSDCYEAQLCYGSWMEAYAGNKIVEGFVHMIDTLK